MLPVLQEAQRPRLAPPPLIARLEAPKPPAPEPPKLEPPALPPVRPAPVARAVQPAPAPPPLLRIEPSKQAAEPALVVPAPAPVAPAPAASAAAQPATQLAAPAGDGPDPGAISRFRLELMDLARRYKKYPRIAQDNNWEGRVELRIAIGEDGAISSLIVKKGAGRAVLDDEAQAMIRTAKSKATIPPGLRGKAFTLEIPVDFFLKDGEK
jgi:protein TonB